MKHLYKTRMMSLLMMVVASAQSQAQIVLHEATNITQTKATLSADFPDLSAEHGFQYKYGSLPEIDDFSRLALSPLSDPVQIDNTSSYAWSARIVKGWVESNPKVPVGQASKISVDITVSESTDISFDWSVDSEEGVGVLSFIVDEVEIETISGLVDFNRVSYNLAKGKHTICWSYNKNRTSNIGLDLGKVMNIYISNTTSGTWITESILSSNIRLIDLYPFKSYLFRAYNNSEYSAIGSFTAKSVSCDSIIATSVTQSTITLKSNVSECDGEIEKGFIVYKDIDPFSLSILSPEFNYPEIINEIKCDDFWHTDYGHLVLDKPKDSPLTISVSLPEKMQISFDWSIRGEYKLIVGAGQRWETFYPIGELYIDKSSSSAALIRSNSSLKYTNAHNTITLNPGKHILKFTADHAGATIKLFNLNIIPFEESSSGGGANNGFTIGNTKPKKVAPFMSPIIVIADGTDYISSKVEGLDSDREYWIRSYIKPLYTNSKLEKTWNITYSPLKKIKTLPVYSYPPIISSLSQATATISAEVDGGDAEIIAIGLQYKDANGEEWTNSPSEINNIASIKINRLKPNTKYRCRAYIQANNCDTVFSKVSNFTTLPVEALMPSIEKVSQHQISLLGKVRYGDAAIYQQGMQFRKVNDSFWINVEDQSNDSIFTFIKRDLEMGATYQARTYVQPAGCDIIYSDILEFTTLDTYFTKCNSNERTQTTITFVATLSDVDEDITVERYGFEYFIDSDGFFENADTYVKSEIFDIPAEPDGKELKAKVTGLCPYLGIRWRAYAVINGNKIYYTSSKNLTWDFAGTDRATIKASIKKITQSSISLDLDATQDGDAIISQIEYALANSVKDTQPYSICGNTLTLNNLIPNKQYNLRFRGIVNERYCPLLKEIGWDYSWFEYKTLPVNVNVVFSEITQTKAKIKIVVDAGDANVANLRYCVDHGEILPCVGEEQLLINLIPGQSYSITIFANVNGEEMSWSANSSDSPFKFTTKSVTSVVAVGDIDQTSVSLNWFSNCGDATFIASGLEIGNTIITSANNSDERIINELLPGNKYSCRSFVETQEGGRVYSSLRAFTTKIINTKTLLVSNISNRSATMNGEIDCDTHSSAEFGFQWKQMIGWQSAPAFTKGVKREDGAISVALVNGMLEPNTDYQFRTAVRYHDEIYASNDWQTFRTESEFIYYPATVYTVFRTDRENNALIMCGYYVAGSESIVGQGYEYWAIGQQSARMYASQQVITVNTDESMEYVFNNGDLSNGNYAVRAFVKTESGETLYGATLNFSVSENGYSGIEGINTDNVRVFVDGTTLKVMYGGGLSCCIYNLNGMIISERTDMTDYEEFNLAKNLIYIVKLSNGKVLKICI